tara:strand:- start:304 stop:474 length:171 start_codon:yes stop_codon:yes gene_type:complete
LYSFDVFVKLHNVLFWLIVVMFNIDKDSFNLLKFGLGLVTGYALGLFSYILFNYLF